MLPPDFEYWPSDKKGRFLRYSPGMLVAEEVDRMLRGTTKPLTDEDIAEATPVISQATTAATAIPGFIWKRVLPNIARRLHPGLVNIAVILIGAALPALVYWNASMLFEFLIRIGVFEVVDWLRTR